MHKQDHRSGSALRTPRGFVGLSGGGITVRSIAAAATQAIRLMTVAIAFMGLTTAVVAHPPDAGSRDLNGHLDAVVGPDWTNNVAPGEWCGTHQRYIARLIAHGMNPPEFICEEVGPCDNPIERDAFLPAVDTPIKTYRLSIHVFCANNGGNCAATLTDVAAAVGVLNDNYAPWMIQFVYDVKFIKSTAYLTLSADEEWGMKNAYAISPATRLNIYVVNTGGISWGTFPWDPDALGSQGGIVMHKDWFVASSPLPAVLTHEVGHCLGLWHTFHGVDEVPQCSACYEPAGRPPEVGDTTGDRCSDTNPTPKNTNNCFDPPGTDSCSGNEWVATPYLNYMGYSHPCKIEFTPQQAGRMHCWTADVLNGWLVLPEPPATPGAPTLTKISGGQIRVLWADNSNDEDGFRVQREKKSGANWILPTIIADVEANITVVFDAPGAGTFRYRVQAYNELGDSPWSAWTQIKN